MKKLFIVLAVLTALVPLGLISENPAWGEWESDFYEKTLGFVPQGIQKGSSWEAPVSDYAVSSLGEVSSYYLSALIGLGVIFGVYLLVRKVLHVRG
ncbi:PDGLE domain-containing protein [Hydrogenimonas sp.]